MGEWEEVTISYRDLDGNYCECCGKHISRHIYVAPVDDVTHRFCGPDCADLYEWYWLPRYGSRQPSAISPGANSSQGEDKWR